MGTILVLAILAAVVGLIVRGIVRDRKSGGACGGCGGGCGGCSGCAAHGGCSSAKQQT